MPTGTAIPPFTVSGQVRYYSNALPVAAVEVHVDGATSTVVNTDANGTDAATQLSQANWTFEPQMHGGAGAGISALDASYILQSLVGMRQLSAEQRLACDTSGNGSLSALDAAYILQYLVHLLPSLPVTQSCGLDWMFIPVPATATNQVLVDPQLAVGSCQPGAIKFQPLTSDASGQDFSAILFGDCTGNWQPPVSGLGPALVSRSFSQPTVRLGSSRGGRGGRVRFPLLVETVDGFHALSAQITYDPRELRLAAVRPSAAAQGAMVEVNSSVTGTVVIALASAKPIAGGGAPTLLLDFERRGASRIARPRLHSASVDERSAR